MVRPSLVALSLLPALAYAGLESATHAKVLTAKNFDNVIAQPEKGVLVGFHAPWCGHCTNLAPTWDKLAESFENDERCYIASMDADNAENKPVAHRYGVSGYPTIKFFPKNGGPIAYEKARSEQDFLSFLNEHCGTQKGLGGEVLPMAGILPDLSPLVSQFYSSPTPTRSSILASASALASSLGNSNLTSSSYDFYVKALTKISEDENWLKKELTRLGKMIENKAKLSGKKLEQLQIKQNILNAFAKAQEAVASGAESMGEAAEAVKEKVEEVVGSKREEL